MYGLSFVLFPRPNPIFKEDPFYSTYLSSFYQHSTFYSVFFTRSNLTMWFLHGLYQVSIWLLILQTKHSSREDTTDISEVIKEKEQEEESVQASPLILTLFKNLVLSGSPKMYFLLEIWHPKRIVFSSSHLCIYISKPIHYTVSFSHFQQQAQSLSVL